MTLDERRFTMPDGLDDLRAELESCWPSISARLHASGVPLNEETEDERIAREAAEAAAAAAAAKTFTQADIDRIVQERLARDRKERPSDDEIAELRAAKAKLEEIDSANLSELDKEREARAAAEKERDEALTTAKETLLRSAILAEAGKADRKVVDPEAVLTLLDKKSLTLDDSGNPTNIAEAMDALLEAKPYLVGGGSNNGTRQNGADQGSRGGGGDQLTSVDGMSPSEIAAAVAAGKLDAYMASKT